MFNQKIKIEFKAKRTFKNKYRESSYQQGLKTLLALWLCFYGICILVSIAPPLTFFIISGFELAPTYEISLLNTLKMASIWLIPTFLLLAAIQISKSQTRY
jgi:hypothetical protein